MKITEQEIQRVAQLANLALTGQEVARMAQDMSDTLATNACKCLWAKSEPRHPLWRHLLDAAAVSLALADRLPDPCWRAEQTALIVGLHDVGKADAAFQHQVAEFSEKPRQAGFPATDDARCPR